MNNNNTNKNYKMRVSFGKSHFEQALRELHAKYEYK